MSLPHFYFQIFKLNETNDCKERILVSLIFKYTRILQYRTVHPICMHVKKFLFYIRALNNIRMKNNNHLNTYTIMVTG